MLIQEEALATGTLYDVVVVGGGPAALTLASELDGSGLKILLVEAGSATKPNRKDRSDMGGTIEHGSSQPRLDLFRSRGLGGTSRIWGGRCIPYDRVDFAERDWIPGPGWPISYDAVSSRMDRAMSILEAGALGDDPKVVLPAECRELVQGLDGKLFHTTLERFSRPTDLWRRFGEALTRSHEVHVMMRTQAVHLAMNASGGDIEGLDLSMPSGATLRVRSRAYVLAAGGLETPRLLLASDDVQPAGIGNEFGHVGRHYMSHLCTTLGSIVFSADRTTACGYSRDAAGIYVRRRLWLTAEAQREYRLLNVTFRTHLPEPADPAHRDPVLSAMFLAKSFVQREYASKFVEAPVGSKAYFRHAANIARGPLELASFARDWTRDRIRADRKLPSVVRDPIDGRHALEFHCEQSPDPTNRVTLGLLRDSRNMRRMHVAWKVSETDIAALRRTYELLGQELMRTGAGRLEADLDTLPERIRRFGLAGGHHIGTTRMSSKPNDGVVDPECRVHGVLNLWIAGPSVMPTSSQANPTATFVALALRLSDNLRFRLTGRDRGSGTRAAAWPSLSTGALAAPHQDQSHAT